MWPWPFADGVLEFESSSSFWSVLGNSLAVKFVEEGGGSSEVAVVKGFSGFDSLRSLLRNLEEKASSENFLDVDPLEIKFELEVSADKSEKAKFQ